MKNRNVSSENFRIQRGSALIIVLWVIALLSFLVITTLMLTMQDTETVAARKAIFRARQLAEMGVAVASNPQMKRGDPLLRRHISNTESYEAVITSEEARLNLNALLTQDRSPVLAQVFIRWGMPIPDAEALVDRLMDWADHDEFKRLKGAERLEYSEAGYPDRPYNHPFQTLDEAGLVFGMDALKQLRPDWQDWFTLRGSGQLDINEASADMLSVLTGTPPQIVNAILARRDGPDGIPGTADDTRFESVEEAVALLGENVRDMSPLLTVESTTLRVRSIGHAGDCSREVSVTLDRTRGTPRVLEWRESAAER